MKDKFVAIILAAGLSSRMGGYPKPLIMYKNKFFLSYILTNLKKLKAEKIIVVLGYQKDLILKYFSNTENIEFIYNENYEAGQFSSLLTGLNYLDKLDIEYNFILLTLCDVPLVKFRTYQKILKNAERNKIVIPSYQMHCGHPIIFDKIFKENFLKEKLTSNAKNVISNLKEYVKYIEVNDDKILKDFDTIDDIPDYNYNFLELQL